MKFILVAESGADLPPEIASKYSIYIVPMHVTFRDITKDDGFFPTEEIFAYYDKTKKIPKTSGSTPGDFEKVFDEIHEKYPDRHILHLAYSAATTCSYQSALIAAASRDYVTSIDTKHVTIGQGMTLLSMAEFLKDHPDISLEEAVTAAKNFCAQSRMCFFPGDLAYLKAGGRVSNAAYLGAKVLSITPLIELKDGKLVATKKYRGRMERIAMRLLQDFTEEKKLKRDFISFVYSPGFSEQLREAMTEKTKELGFQKALWFKTGGVISSHAGPGAIGMCGFSDQ